MRRFAAADFLLNLLCSESEPNTSSGSAAARPPPAASCGELDLSQLMFSFRDYKLLFLMLRMGFSFYLFFLSSIKCFLSDAGRNIL